MKSRNIKATWIDPITQLQAIKPYINFYSGLHRIHPVLDSSPNTILAVEKPAYFKTMCNYFEAPTKFKDCEKTPPHVIKRRQYDRCNEARRTGYTCVDSKPAKGENGKIIQMGITTAPGKCPACLS